MTQSFSSCYVTLPPALEAIVELIRCGCLKSKCESARCKCIANKLPVVKYAHVTQTKMKKSAVTEHQRVNLTQAVTQKMSNNYIENEQHFIKPYVVDSYNCFNIIILG